MEKEHKHKQVEIARWNNNLLHYVHERLQTKDNQSSTITIQSHHMNEEDPIVKIQSKIPSCRREAPTLTHKFTLIFSSQKLKSKQHLRFFISLLQTSKDKHFKWAPKRTVWPASQVKRCASREGVREMHQGRGWPIVGVIGRTQFSLGPGGGIMGDTGVSLPRGDHTPKITFPAIIKIIHEDMIRAGPLVLKSGPSTAAHVYPMYKAVISEEHKENNEETYDIYLLPPDEDPDACQSYLRMRNRDGKYNLMFEEWVTDSPFIISPRITFEVSVRLLGGPMALGYSIAAILKRSSHVFSDDRVTVKIDWSEQLNRSYIQVQGRDRQVVKCVADQLGLEDDLKTNDTGVHSRPRPGPETAGQVGKRRIK